MIEVDNNFICGHARPGYVATTLKLGNRQSLEIISKIEKGKWIPVAERSNSSDQS